MNESTNTKPIKVTVEFSDGTSKEYSKGIGMLGNDNDNAHAFILFGLSSMNAIQYMTHLQNGIEDIIVKDMINGNKDKTPGQMLDDLIKMLGK